MSRGRIAWLFGGLLFALVPLGLATAHPADPLPPILATIDGERAFALATELAGPAYEGRGTGEPGLFAAAWFIAERYRAWGIQPVDAAAGDFNQRFRVEVSRTSGPTQAALLPATGDPIVYEEVVDYQPFPYGSPGEVEGEVVFVGYGIHAPDLGYDDYAGIDLTGKIVFVMRHAPGHDMERFSDHATFLSKAKTAKEQGAIGMVLVTDPNAHEDYAPLDFPSASLHLAAPFAAVYLHTGRTTPWFAEIGQPLTAIQAAIDESGTPMSFPLKVRARLEVPTQYDPARETVNVVGWLPGSDAKLRKEVVVIGAHLDHLGMRGTRLYPGADDNSSGSVALMEVAQALAHAERKPKRSVLFIHFSGEEMGLLGSEHFVAEPLLPPGTRMIAMLNMDMVGLGNGGLTTLTPPEAESERLTGLVELQRARYFAPAWSVEQLNFGNAQSNSDHAPFAKAGIPALFFISSGPHPDYHQPGDTPDKLVPGILEGAAQMCTAVAWYVAENGVPTRPLPIPRKTAPPVSAMECEH